MPNSCLVSLIVCVMQRNLTFVFKQEWNMPLMDRENHKISNLDYLFWIIGVR